MIMSKDFFTLYLRYIGIAIIALVFICGLYTIIGFMMAGPQLSVSVVMLGIVAVFVAPAVFALTNSYLPNA